MELNVQKLNGLHASTTVFLHGMTCHYYHAWWVVVLVRSWLLDLGDLEESMVSLGQGNDSTLHDDEWSLYGDSTPPQAWPGHQTIQQIYCEQRIIRPDDHACCLSFEARVTQTIWYWRNESIAMATWHK